MLLASIEWPKHLRKRFSICHIISAHGVLFSLRMSLFITSVIDNSLWLLYDGWGKNTDILRDGQGGSARPTNFCAIHMCSPFGRVETVRQP